jgi:hypothetical protein
MMHRTISWQNKKEIVFGSSCEISISRTLFLMFGGGFWGTPREDEWRRRKEKEDAREHVIRTEEQKRLDNVCSEHKQEMEAKRQELAIAKNLLHGTRGVARGRDNEEGGTAVDESKPTAAQKRKLDNSEDETWMIRENLLALSYAMFDTLYDKPTFDSAPFVKFLLKQGDVALAEQIALSGLHKSKADGKDVSFILEELLPVSGEPDHLVQKIQEELSGEAAKKSGNAALMNWFLSNGKEEDAFATILLHPDQKEVFLSAFSMATTPERRSQLAARCPRFLSGNTVGCFPDGQWLPFIQFLHKRKNLAERLENITNYRDWEIEPKEYLFYAGQTNNSTVGQYALDCMLKSKIPSMLEPDGYSSVIRHTSGTLAYMAGYVRDQAAQQMRKELEQFTKLAETKEIQATLRKLTIDPMHEFAQRMMQLFPTPTTTCCSTHHKKIRTAEHCATCRNIFYKLAAFVGVASVLRQEIAPRLVQEYGLAWPILRQDGTWSLPVNEHTESAMSALFGTLEQRQLVCVGQPIPAIAGVKKEDE